ncbi:MAG: (2Fe-2S) ferredoxin domain-containing protein [Firmicutes bacterium]|nr:(2Fe-2S) ferredoxin domain-containing protein [Bacillota bacterium]
MKTLNELQEIRKQVKNQVANRGIVSNSATNIVVSMDTCGINAGAKNVLKAFNAETYRLNLLDIIIAQSGCGGDCKLEPVVYVTKDGVKTTYANITPEKAVRIINEHIVGGKIIKEFINA